MPFQLDALTPTVLNNYRLQTDPLADDLIDAIEQSGSVSAVNQVMMTLFRNDGFPTGQFDHLGPEITELLTDYIETSKQLPDWADAQRIKAGERVFAEQGPIIFMLLNLSSLPLCYSCAKGAQVLFETGRLLTHGGNTDPLARRLMETAQMVVNCLSEGGLSDNGQGIVTLQKVRLIHASIRYYLKKGEYKGKKWDVNKYGEPINQEDLAGTLMSFGPVIISGLNQLGSQLSEKQMADYMHCWKVVGHLMGIRSELLPDTYEQAFGLATKILAHQSANSEAGEALTASCVKFINDLLPGNAFSTAPNYLIHYFLQPFAKSSGKDLAGCIGVSVEETSRHEWMLHTTQFITKEVTKLEDIKFFQRLAKHLNTFILQGVIHHFNDGKQVHFFIPPSLQKEWKLNSQWKDYWTTPSIFGNRLSLQKKT